MELVEHPGLGPITQPPPARHPGTEAQLLRQVFPPDAGVEHEQDPLQHQPIRQRLRPGPAYRTGRQQRLDPGPQLVGDNPGRSHAKIISNQDHQCDRGSKWVAGISDTFALGLLNEAIGLRLPIVVAPYAKSSLAAHPAYAQSLRTLGEWGVTVLPNEVIRVGVARDVFDWRPVVDALDGV